MIHFWALTSVHCINKENGGLRRFGVISFSSFGAIIQHGLKAVLISRYLFSYRRPS